MIRTLGNPVGRLTTDCQDVRAASTVVQALIETRNFGNFNATGIKPALDSLSRILDKAKEKDPDLFNAIGTAGMLCVRLRRPTSGAPSNLPSNHSWGIAIDITINRVADITPDGFLQRGIAELIPLFNAERWFSGAGFKGAEDDTHFEVADETIEEWEVQGLFDVQSPALVAGVDDPGDFDGRARRAFDFFVQSGWTKEQAAGLIASIEAESSFNPHGPAGDHGMAIGLCQWHPDRQENFRQQFGLDLRDAIFGQQLEFVNFELRQGTEKPAGARLVAAANAQDAGEIVSRFYERPNDPDGAVKRRRGAAAVNWFTRLA